MLDQRIKTDPITFWQFQPPSSDPSYYFALAGGFEVQRNDEKWCSNCAAVAVASEVAIHPRNVPTSRCAVLVATVHATSSRSTTEDIFATMDTICFHHTPQYRRFLEIFSPDETWVWKVRRSGRCWTFVKSRTAIRRSQQKFSTPWRYFDCWW